LFDRRDIDIWLETQKDGRFTEIRERRPSRSGSGPRGNAVIDPLARQIAQRFKKRLLESSERCSEARLGDYMRHRLTQVKRATLKKELSALNRLFDWMVQQGLLSTKPTIPRIPKRATGTPHPKRKRETVTLTPEEMHAIVTQLPERSKLGYPMRAYYEVMRETADKARYGRELPLSARARAALDSACPNQGTISRSSTGDIRSAEPRSPPPASTVSVLPR
jgi:hypothetical protein